MEWQVGIAQARAGRTRGFDVVVRRFQGMAVAYAYALLRDLASAEDAAQDAFIQAYGDLHMLREPAAFPAWFRRIVFKHCDRARRGKRLPTAPMEAADGACDPSADPRLMLERREARREVLDAVDALPDNERLAITLFYMNGCSMVEIAAFLETPISTVKSRLHTGRRHLRERMVRDMDEVRQTLRGGAPGEAFTEKVRKVLEGIERVHWCVGACVCFPGSMASVMRYLGEDVTDDYVMGISGGSFFLYWLVPWAPSNCDVLMIGEEPVRRAFAAMGYGYTFLQDTDKERPREFYRDAIVASLDGGRPVLGDGVVGPPEICVISGYDNGGDALYGWSYFQEDDKAYFRADDWYPNTYGFITVGEKGPTPSPREVLGNTLEWAIRLARMPEFDGVVAAAEPVRRHVNGLAVYDEMAARLRDPAEWRDIDDAALEMRCIALGNDGLFLLTGKRESAARFLRSMAEHALPGSDRLLAAAAAYDDELAVLKQVHPLTPWTGSPMDAQRKLLDPAHREEMAGLVLEAKAHEERAVAELEAALAALLG